MEGRVVIKMYGTYLTAFDGTPDHIFRAVWGATRKGDATRYDRTTAETIKENWKPHAAHYGAIRIIPVRR